MQEEGIDDVRAPDTSHRERLIGGGIDVHDTFGSSFRGGGWMSSSNMPTPK